MLTKKQEEFLAEFADKGLAEQAEAQARNEQIAKDQETREARDAKLAELQTQAQELIDTGLKEFDEAQK